MGTIALVGVGRPRRSLSTWACPDLDGTDVPFRPGRVLEGSIELRWKNDRFVESGRENGYIENEDFTNRNI